MCAGRSTETSHTKPLNHLLHSLLLHPRNPCLQCVMFTKGFSSLNGRDGVCAIEGSMISCPILVATRMPNLECAASPRQCRYRDAVTRLAECMMDMQSRHEIWQEACRMSFDVAMTPLYISTLLSGSATRYFHYDEDGTNILHSIREMGMLQSACFYGIADCSHPVLTGTV